MLLPADGGRRRMLARGRKVRAVARALNLDEPLGAAADRTDLVAERRTGAPRLPLRRRGDTPQPYYCIIPRKSIENSSERGLHSPDVVTVERGISL